MVLFFRRSGVWDKSCQGLHILVLELNPICVALSIWEESLLNKCINLVSDNMAVVCIINSFTTKDKFLMILLRHSVFICMIFNILVKSTHLPGYLIKYYSRQIFSWAGRWGFGVRSLLRQGFNLCARPFIASEVIRNLDVLLSKSVAPTQVLSRYIEGHGLLSMNVCLF